MTSTYSSPSKTIYSSPSTIRNAHLATIFGHYLFVLYISFANATGNSQGVQNAALLLGVITFMSLWPILGLSSQCQRGGSQIQAMQVRISHVISISMHALITAAILYTNSRKNRHGVQVATIVLGILTSLALYPITVNDYSCISSQTN